MTMPSMGDPPSSGVKQPRPVFDRVFAFPPNRDTLGGTAYLIINSSDYNARNGNLLVDCPAWDELHQTFLAEQGGIRWLFLTHRGGFGKVREIQTAFNCEVVLQEQEAYLLPGLDVTTFRHDFELNPTCRAFWTPGFSPGSACLYYNHNGGILFSGRHVLPNQQGEPVPLRISKTFHWKRQLRSVQRLLDDFSPDTLQFICPGANTGFLRGQRAIARAYEQLAQLDLEQLLLAKPGL